MLRQCWCELSTSTLACAGNQYTSFIPRNGTGAYSTSERQGLQANILQGVANVRDDLADYTGSRINPRRAGKLERILPSAQCQGSDRTGSTHVLERDFVEPLAANHFVLQAR